MEHIGNINGIFISAESEFQDGAKKVSSYNGIRLIKYDELYKFINGEKGKYLVPDYKTIGDPFWMFMNLKHTRTRWILLSPTPRTAPML